jgi:putative NADH-flavin reductase
MKIIVFGATGKTGVHIVNQLLNKHHTVTVYVRNAGKMLLNNPNLKVIENSMDNISALAEAIKGQDAVVSCLGSGSLKKSTTLETFGKQIHNAMKTAGVTKIIYMATAGIHKEIKGIAGIIVNMILGNVINDHGNAVRYFMNDAFTYTIVRPVQLIDAPLTGKYLTSDGGVPGRKAISRANFAHFIVDVVETDKYNNQSVGLSG